MENSVSDTKNIIIFPDFEKLKNEVKKLRSELSMLVLERDELRFVKCKNIEMIYMLKLGSLEYKAYEVQCVALRLKRKIELIQAKKNRMEKVVLGQIESILDAEFAEYQEKLNEQIDKMNEAIERSHADVLSEEDNRELKKLYRTVVKNLHPDLNPDVTESQIVLFENAVTAYKNGDLCTLRIVAEMVADRQLPDSEKDAMSVLAEEKIRLEKHLKIITDSIDKIKSEYPYTVKSIIENPDKITERKAELEEIIEEYQEIIAVYRTRIEEMLR